MTERIRTRYAPSPTGYPHIGNIRTALFEWLFARHHQGDFVLRIEDTDVERSVEGSLEYILEGMRWLGMDWDEGPGVGGSYGPYVQSQRLHLYQDAANKLVESGHAYYCYCSEERLEALRAEQVKSKMPSGYDRHCRNLLGSEQKTKEADGIKPVVRFKTPLTGKTRFHDEIWGDLVFENSHIEDVVLLKSDGYPTYHLGNVVDDHAMEISHVIRAEEYISSTPLHLMTYEALGYSPPRFAHVPMVLGADRSKLGKRHGATSVLEFRDQGYLPEALLNFLALVGWSLDDKTDIISRDELIKNFSLERVSKTAAIFNHEKLKWMNGVYIRRLSVDDLMDRIYPFMEKDLPPEVKRPLDINYVRQIVPLIHERIFTLKDAATYAEFFFIDELAYDSAMLIGKKMTAETTLTVLRAAQEKLSLLESFSHDLLEDTLRHLANDLGIKTGELFNPLRAAITARDAAPPLFETMAVLGKERCLKRINAALAKLAGN